MQQTFDEKISYTGVGLHSGYNVKVNILPAPENTGIVFKRTDIAEAPKINALYSLVADTRNCTCLKKDTAVVSTIEHIMATLYAYGIDNAVIETDNQEFPIMDGSAKMFCDIFENAKIKKQNTPRKCLKALKTIRFEDKDGNYAELSPAEDFSAEFCIDFPSKIVGHQEFSCTADTKTFAKEIAPARTFCEKYQVDYLRSIGLIKGGSLENAVVLDGESILNPEGFRLEKECVRHKILDAIGDMYTSGYRIKAHFKGYHSGHFHNNELLKKLFSDKSNFEIVEE